MMTDPIADMLTRLRNGVMARHSAVTIPSSRLKLEVARVLKEEGFIRSYRLVRDKGNGPSFPMLKVQLKYGPDGESIVHGLSRVSRPGLRIYRKCQDLPEIFRGIGVAIVSTSQGVMTERGCRKANGGGEVLCKVWQRIRRNEMSRIGK